MSKTFTAPFPQSPIIGIASLVAPAAITSRANITGTTGLVALTTTSTDGTRIDGINIKGAGTTALGIISVWLYNGTTSYLIDEISCAAVTPSAILAGDFNSRLYYNFTLPPTYQLFVSSTISQNYNVTALGAQF